MNKILICYFSATETTKKIAEEIGKILPGNLFEICSTNKYTSEDLVWVNKKSRTTITIEHY